MRYPSNGSNIRISNLKLLLVLMLTVLVATGCGSGGTDGDGLGGSIVISGSSTVEPISIGIAEKFGLDNPGVKISVDGPGTGDGFELFCKGETDISDASRAISESEVAACEAAGVEYLELKVANDGIVVLTSPENDVIDDCLSFSDLYSVVGPESQGFDNWSDGNSLAAAIGSTKAAPFDNAPLAITGPGEESGTYDSFVELVLEDIADGRGQDAQTRPDYQASADDNVIVQGIEGSPNSLGWVGYAFYDANRNDLKAFRIAGEDGECVEPSRESIADNSYPISRPLYIYVNTTKMDENPALEAFIELYLSDDGLVTAGEAGYVELSEEEAAETIAAYQNRAS